MSDQVACFTAEPTVAQLVPECDHMRLGNTIQVRGTCDPHSLDEIPDRPAVGRACVLGRKVREPETLGRHDLERILIVEITRLNRPHQLETRKKPTGSDGIMIQWPHGGAITNPSSLFNLSEHLDRMSKDGDPLEVLEVTVDIALCRAVWL